MFTAHIDIKFNRLPNLTPALNRRAEEIVEGAAFACEGLAKSIAPIDTGALRSSIQASPESRLSWVVAVEVEYGINVELGTSTQAAQPYLTPASENVRHSFLGQMQQVVDEVARQ